MNRDNTGVYQGTAQKISVKSRGFELPHPDERWKLRDVPEVIRDNIVWLSTEDIVKRVDFHSTDNVTIFQTDETAYREWNRYREKHEQSDGFLPCGHDPFMSHAETVECLVEGCGQVHRKEDLR